MKQSAILFCNSCQFEIATVEIRKQHYKSDWHRYNVKRRCAGLEKPIEKEVFFENLATLRSLKKQSKATKCSICNKTFHSNGAYQQHLLSKTHKKRSSKIASRKSRMTSEVSSIHVTSTTTTPTISTSTTTATITSSEMATENTSEVVINITDSKTLHPDDMKLASDKNDQIIDEQKQIEHKEIEHKAIPVGNCLFCTLKFINTEEAMKHMYKRHGFWIPDIEHIVHLEDFLAYLGEKVGLGRICLHCNGRKKAVYRNLRSVRQHMEDKSHCMIRWDELDMDEYDIFFKYPGEDEGDEGDEGDDLPKKNVKKRGVADFTLGGELILHDGSIIGHRAFLNAYKQRLVVEDTREEVVIARLEAECRKLVARQNYHKQKHGFSERTRPIWKTANLKYMKVGCNANRLQQRYFRMQNPIIM